jgi:hypothetical protein
VFDTRAVRTDGAVLLAEEAAGAGADARRARLAVVADQVRPVVLAREHTLPLAASLTALFPEGALRRGITIAVDGTGAASVALLLAAAPVRAGSWVAFVDLSALNLAAAAEAGITLERVACIRSGEQWGAAVAALLGAFDLVVVGMGRRVRPTDVRRLGARARERGSVLVALRGVSGNAVWPEAPDVTLEVDGSRWSGLGMGHGHLRARTLTVRAHGRRGFAQPRHTELILHGDTDHGDPDHGDPDPVQQLPERGPVIARAG